jgi:hypothetical protein
MAFGNGAYGVEATSTAQPLSLTERNMTPHTVRDSREGFDERATAHRLAEPVHKHPSAALLLAKETHRRIAPFARLMISWAPARIQGLVTQRLAGISGEIEKCPVCPHECPVP